MNGTNKLYLCIASSGRERSLKAIRNCSGDYARRIDGTHQTDQTDQTNEIDALKAPNALDRRNRRNEPNRPKFPSAEGGSPILSFIPLGRRQKTKKAKKPINPARPVKFTKLRTERISLGYILVCQAKPGQSCELKGVHLVSCPFGK